MSTSAQPSVRREAESSISHPYSPQALLSAVNNSLTSPILNEVLAIKGVYQAGKGVAYRDYYYDWLRDEYGEAGITLAVPGLLRQQVKDGQVIQGLGCLVRRPQVTAGKIELILQLTELIGKEDRVVDESARQAMEIVRRKVKLGYKDADQSIRKRFYGQEPVRMRVLIGLGAIVGADIRRAVGEAVVACDLQFVRVNLGKPDEIIRAMREAGDVDLLAIACGGGDHLAVFDQPAISEQALNLKPVFVTALGHAVDEPLLQKVADKAFITPTAFGQYVNHLYQQTHKELSESQVKLMADLRKQLSSGYESRINDLQARVNEVTKAANKMGLQMDAMSGRLARSRTRMAVLVTVILVLLVLLVRNWLR